VNRGRKQSAPFNAVELFVTGFAVEPCRTVCRWFLPEDPASAHIDKNTMIIARAAAVGVVNRPWLMID
jgi:hypothetical protein